MIYNRSKLKTPICATLTYLPKQQENPWFLSPVSQLPSLQRCDTIFGCQEPTQRHRLHQGSPCHQTTDAHIGASTRPTHKAWKRWPCNQRNWDWSPPKWGLHQQNMWGLPRHVTTKHGWPVAIGVFDTNLSSGATSKRFKRRGVAKRYLGSGDPAQKGALGRNQGKLPTVYTTWLGWTISSTSAGLFCCLGGLCFEAKSTWVSPRRLPWTQHHPRLVDPQEPRLYFHKSQWHLRYPYFSPIFRGKKKPDFWTNSDRLQEKSTLAGLTNSWHNMGNTLW